MATRDEIEAALTIIRTAYGSASRREVVDARQLILDSHDEQRAEIDRLRSVLVERGVDDAIDARHAERLS